MHAWARNCGRYATAFWAPVRLYPASWKAGRPVGSGSQTFRHWPIAMPQKKSTYSPAKHISPFPTRPWYTGRRPGTRWLSRAARKSYLTGGGGGPGRAAGGAAGGGGG